MANIGHFLGPTGTKHLVLYSLYTIKCLFSDCLGNSDTRSLASYDLGMSAVQKIDMELEVSIALQGVIRREEAVELPG